MYENEANIIAGTLNAQIPGTASATAGPGPITTVRYAVGGTSIVFNVLLRGDTKEIEAAVMLSDHPDRVIGWSTVEPLDVDGARRTAMRAAEWVSGQIDQKAIEAEFNRSRPKDVHLALHQVGAHPLRGGQKSHDAVTGNGKVVDGKPAAGVIIYRDGDSVRFRLTEVSDGHYAWDEIAMKSTGFVGFVHAMRDLLLQFA